MPRIQRAKRVSKRVPKRAMRNAKAQVARQKKSRAQKNMDTFFLRAALTATLTPSQGATVANYVSWFPQLLNPTSSVSVSQNADFAFWSKIYDRVRINSMTIRVVPKANVLDQANAQNDATYNVSGDGLIHTCIDKDDKPPASISALQRYPSYRKYSVLKPFSRSYSIKYPTSVWLDCKNIYEDETLLKRLGAYGGIYLYAENVLEDTGELFNEPWATVEVMYNCVFQGKTMGALSFNDDTGAVTLLPQHAMTTVDDSLITVLSGQKESWRVDMSGNKVSVIDTDLP